MYLCGVCLTQTLLSVANIILRGLINKNLSDDIQYFVNRHKNVTDFMSCIISANIGQLSDCLPYELLSSVYTHTVIKS